MSLKTFLNIEFLNIMSLHLSQNEKINIFIMKLILKVDSILNSISLKEFFSNIWFNDRPPTESTKAFLLSKQVF